MNARTLSHELLAGIENRGTHAAGFGYAHNGQFEIHKAAVPGSQLTLSLMPRKAKTVILHTRYATQGSATRNWNNHPILSPGGEIALVHNGVISNDWEFRDGLLEGKKIAEVDSAVVPALMEQLEPAGAFELLEGYAAFAWLDSRVGEVLNVARVDFSPVHYTWTDSGSFIFASDGKYIEKALANMGISHGYIFEMAEGEGYAIQGGVIRDAQFDFTMQEDSWSRYRFGSATAGGHGSSGGSETTGCSFQGLASTSGVDDDNPNDEYGMTWDQDYRARSGSMALDDTETNGRFVKQADGSWEYQPYDEADEAEYKAEIPSDFMGFYITMEDGSMEHFGTLEDFEGHLSWLSNLGTFDGAPFENVEHSLKWINWVMDIGTVTISQGLDSWLDDMGKIDDYDTANPAMYSLGYVRDGVSRLLEMKGA